MLDRRNALLVGFCLWSAAALCVAVGTKLLFREHIFWDLGVYQAAADAHRAGAQVYGVPLPDLYFVYAPWVLEVFALLGDWLTPLFLASYAAVVACTLSYAAPSLRWSLLFYFGVLAFVTEPLTASIRSGNLSVFANLLLLILWRMEPRIGPGPLLAAILLFTCIKPQYAAFFGLWLLAGRIDPAMQLRAGLMASFAVALWGAQVLLAPDAFAAFLESLGAQVNLQAHTPDMGVGLFAQIQAATGSSSIAGAAHLVSWLVLAGTWLRLVPRLRHAEAQALILNGAFLLCLLASPRLKVYDTGVLSVICIEALVIWAMAGSRSWPWVAPVVALAMLHAATRLAIDLVAEPFWLSVYNAALPGVFVAVFAWVSLATARGRS